MTWSENRWVVVSALAAIAALIIPIVLFAVGRQSKALAVETISRATVADLTDPALSLLRLTYNAHPVNQVTMVTIEVANRGTRPVEPRDFECPIVIHFEVPDSLLAVTLGEKDPRNLAPQIMSDASSITIAPMLLNPGDRFRLTLLLRGGFSEPTVDSRISGIRSISRGVFREVNLRPRIVLSMVLGLLAILCYIYLYAFMCPIRQRFVTPIPKIDGLIVISVLAITGTSSLILGAILLGISRLAIFWAMAGGMLLLLPPTFLLGFRRRRRVAATYVDGQRVREVPDTLSKGTS
jgi:hypothetical protein